MRTHGHACGMRAALPFGFPLLLAAASAHVLRRHVVAKHPVQPADGVMVPAELWDDGRCGQLVGPAFDAIRHGAYKADLCRLYVLYKHGGVYTDDDIFLLRVPTLTNLTVVRETPQFKSSASEVGLFNAYIEVPRRYDRHMLRAIQLSRRHLQLDYDTSSRALWGPMVLHRALQGAGHVVVHQEVCHSSSPCSCRVPDLLISHKPCRY